MKVRAFSMIEMVVTLVIVGVLTVVSVTVFEGVRTSAVREAALVDLSSLSRQVSGCMLLSGDWSQSNWSSCVDIAAADSMSDAEVTWSRVMSAPTAAGEMFVSSQGAGSAVLTAVAPGGALWSVVFDSGVAAQPEPVVLAGVSAISAGSGLQGGPVSMSFDPAEVLEVFDGDGVSVVATVSYAGTMFVDAVVDCDASPESSVSALLTSGVAVSLDVAVTSTAGMCAEGGVVSEFSDGPDLWRVHEFSQVGGDVFEVVRGGPVEFLVVAGGGGGGRGHNSSGGGGGGAGGVITNVGDTPVALPSGPVTVQVGDGGAGQPSSQYNLNGARGGNSSFATYVALGGGGGANHNWPQTTNIGSGGGGGGISDRFGIGIAGQGFDGGEGGWPYPNWNGTSTPSSPYSYRIAGGGGGAGGSGTSILAGGDVGHGGPGVLSTITGTPTWFAGGGAGGSIGSGGSAAYGQAFGGVGGGGDGMFYGPVYATDGVDGLGGGGGGGSSGYADSAGDGGSGTVIVRYLVS